MNRFERNNIKVEKRLTNKLNVISKKMLISIGLFGKKTIKDAKKFNWGIAQEKFDENVKELSLKLESMLELYVKENLLNLKHKKEVFDFKIMFDQITSDNDPFEIMESIDNDPDEEDEYEILTQKGCTNLLNQIKLCFKNIKWEFECNFEECLINCRQKYKHGGKKIL